MRRVCASLSVASELSEFGGAQLFLVDLARLALGLEEILHPAVICILRIAATVPGRLVHVG